MAFKRKNGNGSNGSNAESNSPVAEAPAQSTAMEPVKFRENQEVNAKIDGYIQKNPKEWAYLQSMPRERLDLSLVLQSVQKQERQEKMRAGILKKLEENLEPKEAYRNLVKNLPVEQQENAIASLAARTMRTVAPPAQQQAQAARV